jgi:hypothetical protein
MGVLSRHLALVAIVTLGLVVCLAVAGGGPRGEHKRNRRPSQEPPGPLSQAHADIDGDDHCGKCHQSGKQVVSSLCLDCHEDLEKRIDASAGLHGRNYKGKGCETCHVEHISRKTKLIRWPGGSMDKLDHDLTGYDLEGGHVGPKCLECHTKAQPSGKPSFLGLKEACGSCHKDPHKNRYGAECTTCHRVSTWDDLDLDRFDHDKTAYKLTGLHVDVACQKCHGSPAKWKGIAFDTCASCHADPHEGKFAPTPCADCHDTKSWKGATEAIRKNHPGLSLRNGHRRVDCKRCHDKGIDAAPSKGSACVDCHAPVHEAKFGRGCKSCHKSIEWLGLPEQIGRDAHGKTPYPLTGMHTDVACAKCHPKKLPVDQRYRKLSYDACTGCPSTAAARATPATRSPGSPRRASASPPTPRPGCRSRAATRRRRAARATRASARASTSPCPSAPAPTATPTRTATSSRPRCATAGARTATRRRAGASRRSITRRGR